MMVVTRNRIAANLQRIRERIAEAAQRVRRSPEEIGLVGVTKAVDVETIKNLIDAGVTDLGENRVQQLHQRVGQIGEYLKRRRNELAAPVRWHMIGHLQRNKVKRALEVVDVIHSVDSLRLAEEIDARAEQMGRRIDVFMEVNCSQEPQKYGVAVGAAVHLAELISTLKHLRLVGLMTMAPLVDDPERARPTFARLYELFEEMRNQKIGGDDFRELSMGMSQDYTVAVEEGATVVRIGTALFE